MGEVDLTGNDSCLFSPHRGRKASFEEECEPVYPSVCCLQHFYNSNKLETWPGSKHLQSQHWGRGELRVEWVRVQGRLSLPKFKGSLGSTQKQNKALSHWARRFTAAIPGLLK